jgi:hypothetical protein
MLADSTPQDNFKPFQLYTDAAAKASIPAATPLQFADLAFQSAAGIEAIFKMFEKDDLREDCGEPRLLTAAERVELRMLARSSLVMLQEKSESLAHWVHNEYTPEGKAMKRQQAQLLLGYPVAPHQATPATGAQS